MTEISNSPHRWLLPFWAELKRRAFFDHLAPELQAEALAAALEADYPAKAQEIRGWNFATRRAMLAVLDMADRWPCESRNRKVVGSGGHTIARRDKAPVVDRRL